MKTPKTCQSKKLWLAVVCTLSFFAGRTQTVQLHQADFETGLNGWTLTGTNAARVTTAPYKNANHIRLAANGSTASSPVIPTLGYNKVDVQFFVRSQSLASNYSLTLQYRTSFLDPWQNVRVATRGTGTTFRDIMADGPHYAITATLNSTDFTFGLLSEFRFITSNNGQNTRYFFIDYITVTGTIYNSITTAPGGITSELTLWLRADQIDGTTVQADGTNVNTWVDRGLGHNASVTDATNSGISRPQYRNNATNNINFNPVVDFTNDYTTSPKNVSYTLANRQYLFGTGGFNTQELYIVFVPDNTVNNALNPPMDLFTSKLNSTNFYDEDVTGVGLGAYSARYDNEMIGYAISTNPTPTPADVNLRGYGVAQTGAASYAAGSIMVLSARNTVAGTGQELYLNGTNVGDTEVGVPQFTNQTNGRFWLGRSQAFDGSFDGRIAEVISYSSRRNDATQRPRIESYLAIKYGITQGVNGTSIDYVDSGGTIIWDIDTGVPANDIFDWNIAGIGRDDASGLNQKQSKTINTVDDITIGLATIAATNSANTGTFATDRDFLVWGHNNGTLAAQPPVNVDLSAGIGGLSTPVEFISVGRTWKVVETGGDVPTVQVSIPETMLTSTITPPGAFLMFISDTPSFNPSSEYRIMTDTGANLVTNYDFNGTKYITFGYAPEYTYSRSIAFNGTTDYLDAGNVLDITNAYTLSAWIKRDGTGTIMGKRPGGLFNSGWELLITGGGNLQFRFFNGIVRNTTSTVVIPTGIWHHVAVSYDGTNVRMYIDGVLHQTVAHPAIVSSTNSFTIGAAGGTATSQYFDGNIDEVRVFNTALTADQIRYIMNQEIEANSGFVGGSYFIANGINPTKNDTGTLPWANLRGYYPMSTYTYTNCNDASGNGNTAAIKFLQTVDFQTAPLPYVSTAAGNWNAAGTWTSGAQNRLPNDVSIVDGSPINWNIVSVGHNVTQNTNKTVLCLNSTANELTVTGDRELNVTHYLRLNGTIDLEGESQLVQPVNSNLVATVNGRLERDQQGTQNRYTYNYWSSPVGASAVNGSYTVAGVMRDGTNPASPQPITWLTGSYNGALTTPISLADFWIWKFDNRLDDDYSEWQHVRSTGTLLAGEGFTLKGPGTTPIATPQNYVFIGVPNNGTITRPINIGNDYLVGNPYPSAIDANQFITDNPNLNGNLYFWEHYGGSNHNLKDYQGGYGIYNLSGGVQAVADPDVSPLGTPVKTPRRYVPVSQGFFVVATSTGNVTFNNNQRIFVTEAGNTNSWFFRAHKVEETLNGQNENKTESIADNRAEEDTRMKFRIGYNSPQGYHRQLLLTIDPKTTLGYDWGYDGELRETFIEDMYWSLNNSSYIIQAIGAIDAATELPLGLKTKAAGVIEIMVDALENVPDSQEIYLKDKLTGETHNLRSGKFITSVSASTLDENRFAITFENEETLGTNEAEALEKGFKIVYLNQSEILKINNNTSKKTEGAAVYNLLGQEVLNIKFTENQKEISVAGLRPAVYMVKVFAEGNTVKTQKFIKN